MPPSLRIGRHPWPAPTTHQRDVQQREAAELETAAKEPVADGDVEAEAHDEERARNVGREQIPEVVCGEG